MAGYQRVAALSDLREGGCTAVDALGRSILLVRRGDRVDALENRCPHAGAPLSQGFLEGKLLTCAWHGWTFDVETGRSEDDESTCVPRLSVRIDGDDVLVAELDTAPAAPACVPPSWEEKPPVASAAPRPPADPGALKEILASLNALSLAEISKVDEQLGRAERAIAGLGQDELASRVGDARRALGAGNVKEFRRAISNVTSRLGHLR